MRHIKKNNELSENIYHETVGLIMIKWIHPSGDVNSNV